MIKEILMEEQKKLALEILKSIADFCDKNNLRYYLAYGTMLGAVRHKGFIPWDDDIDIMMPRDDYNKFISSYNGYNSMYKVYSIESDDNYPYTMAKVFDQRTKLEDFTLWEQYPYSGVFVDIFPIDGLPKSMTEQRKLFNHQQLLNLLLHGSCMKYTFSHHYVDSKGSYAKIKALSRTILKFAAITLMHPLPTASLVKKINRDASRYPFDQSTNVSVLVDCASGNKREILPRDIFLEPKLYDFEQYQFKGIANYDFYLTHLFHNYMEMPPVDRRVPHHNFKVYWR